MAKNRVCEILGIEKPILQGPMAWAATAPLVGAVSAAGGLGVLGVAFADHDFIRTQIRTVKKMTDNPFGFNAILSKSQNLESLTQLIAEEKPCVIHLDALRDVDYDFAKKYFDKWHELGLKIVAKVFTMKDVKTVDLAGADVIIVKGWEGGGVVTEQSTLALVPQARDTTKKPLVASGGIADGRGMAAALVMGAEGIEMGTRFLASEESPVQNAVKQKIISTGDMGTVVAGVSCGVPCRQIINELSAEVLRVEAENVRAVAAPIVDALTTGTSRRAFIEGDTEKRGAIMASQSIALIKKSEPVLTIIDSMLEECKTVIEQTTKFSYR